MTFLHYSAKGFNALVKKIVRSAMSTFNLHDLYKDFDSKLRVSYRVRETSEEVQEAQQQKLEE